MAAVKGTDFRFEGPGSKQEYVHIYDRLSVLELRTGKGLYGVDIKVPSEWREWLKTTVPQILQPKSGNDLLQYLPLQVGCSLRAKKRAELKWCLSFRSSLCYHMLMAGFLAAAIAQR